MQPIDHDGQRGPVEPFTKERMDELLKKREVKEVAVFNLKEGMELEIYKRLYRVTRIRPNGTVVMKYKGRVE